MSDFSTECPELLQLHFDHLRKSAISVEVIRERGYCSILNDNGPSGKHILRNLGFSQAQIRPPGILIPLFAPDNEKTLFGHQFRSDRPRRRDDKDIKYESRAGMGIRLDVPLRCRLALGNTSVPLWITEGAKKADALASQGACAINLLGVWGFKGKNDFGNSTFLADWDFVALKGRLTYVVYDSDVITKRSVQLALDRLIEHLSRKGANVRVVRLQDKDGCKVGADDYLADGHSLADLVSLVAEPGSKKESEEIPVVVGTKYSIESGVFCMQKRDPDLGRTVKFPLANWHARITEELVRDNGSDIQTSFILDGFLGKNYGGKALPGIEIPASSYASLNWVAEKWGAAAIISAGASAKDHLRSAIQQFSAQSGMMKSRRIFEHTGWRVIDGERCFLSCNGALGKEGVEVSLHGPLGRYQLPSPEELAGISPVDAMQTSLAFLDFGKYEVQCTLWAEMYLAPLCEILDPRFVVWLVGHPGSFKSVLSALALCHFGKFDYGSLPTSWASTSNFLEKLMFLAKDIPLVIDDWHAAATLSEARELEHKADIVIRGKGNKSFRGRLKRDLSFQTTYVPRGLVISSGEQLPAGESVASRLFVIESEKSHIDLAKLSAAQKEAWMYPYAMANFILWLKNNWADLEQSLPVTFEQHHQSALEYGGHMRLPNAVAWLQTAVEITTLYAVEIGALEMSQAQELQERTWRSFIQLSSQQAARVDTERPAIRFLDALSTLIEQQKVVFNPKHKEEPTDNLRPGQQFIGWKDQDYYYLLPRAVCGAVFDFYAHSSEAFTVKPPAVWADLSRLGLITNGSEGHQKTVWVGQGTEEGSTKRVVYLKASALDITKWNKSLKMIE